MEPPRVAVIVSRYNAFITDRLREGALDAWRKRGLAGEPAVVPVPGAFELAVGAGAAVKAGFDAVVCLGCLIKGETTHDQHIAAAVSAALASLSATTGAPVGFGLLTCQTPEQAEARAGGDLGNKGAEAMQATLDALEALGSLRTA